MEVLLQAATTHAATIRQPESATARQLQKGVLAFLCFLIQFPPVAFLVTEGEPRLDIAVSTGGPRLLSVVSPVGRNPASRLCQFSRQRRPGLHFGGVTRARLSQKSHPAARPRAGAPPHPLHIPRSPAAAVSMHWPRAGLASANERKHRP